MYVILCKLLRNHFLCLYKLNCNILFKYNDSVQCVDYKTYSIYIYNKNDTCWLLPWQPVLYLEFLKNEDDTGVEINTVEHFLQLCLFL